MRPFDPRLLAYARRARVPIALVAVLGVLTAGLIIVQAQLLAAGIADESLAVLPLLAFVVAGRVAVAWATEAAAYHASAAVKSALRLGVLGRAVELGPRWLAGQRAGSLTTLATDGVEALDGYFGRYLPQLVLGVVVPVAVVARILAANWLAGATIAVTLPLIPLFGALVGRASGRYAQDRWRALSVLSHHFLDVISGLPTLKVFGRSGAQRAEIGRVTDAYRRTTLGTLRVAFLSSLVLELVATVSVALVAVGVGLSLVYGQVGLRTGLLALILAPEAYLPLRQAAAQFHAVTDGLAAASEALAVIETFSDSDRHNGPNRQTILVDSLSVAHPGRAGLAPDGVSVAVRAGEIAVIAGASGCGKSTLIDVLLGFAQPSGGRVETVDRSRIGWVPQEPYLFPGTVASNIRFGWPQAPDEAVEAAARAAALDDVPLDRVVTERAGGLSAGQRRRVALARALLPDRPFLLLDEPTAGLDADREAHVLATLRAQATAGRAILIAAHHPRVIEIADTVVRLDAGADAVTGPDAGAGSRVETDTVAGAAR
jgi:thiol reductant ABC exporter CydD subunit